MATVTKTFAFLSNAEGYTGVSGPATTMTWDSTVGNPAGSLKTRTAGRNKTDSNYWEWTGTWEGLGVPVGATVTGIQMTSASTRCTEANVVNNIQIGPYTLYDSTGTVLRGTLWGGRTTTSTSASWTVTGAQTAVTFAEEASNTSIRLRLEDTLDVGRDSGAAASVHDDQVTFVITYTPAVAVTPISASDTASISVSDAGTKVDGVFVGGGTSSKNILFIHVDPTPSAGDNTIISELQARGHVITTRSAALGSVASGYDVVFISESGPGATPATWDTVAMGVLTFEVSWQNLRLSSVSATATTAGDWTLSGHEVNTGFTSPINVNSSSTYQVATSALPAGVTAVATMGTEAHAIVAESGAVLTTGTAPARRSAMGISESKVSGMTSTGWDYVSALVVWTGGGAGTWVFPTIKSASDSAAIVIADSGSVGSITLVSKSASDSAAVSVSDTSTTPAAITPLPAKITGVEPEAIGSKAGPYIDTNGNLYRVTEEFLNNPSTGTVTAGYGNHPMMMKSADGGGTWVRMDAANGPGYGLQGSWNDMESSWLEQSGTQLRLVYMKAESRHIVATFNTSDAASNPDKWVVAESVQTTIGTQANESACAIQPLSNGDQVIFFRTGGTNQTITYKKRTAGSWGADNVITEAFHAVRPSTTRNNSNTIYLFYRDDTNGRVYYRTLTSANVLSSATRVDTNGAGGAGGSGGSGNYINNILPPVYYNDGGTDVAVVAFVNSSNQLRTVEVRGGVVGAEQQVSTNSVTINPDTTTGAGTTNQGPVAALAVVGTTLYALWADSADGKVYYATRANGGSWSARTLLAQPSTTVLGGDRTLWLYANGITKPGGSTYVAYTYDVGPHLDAEGGVYYNELLVSAASTTVNKTASDGGSLSVTESNTLVPSTADKNASDGAVVSLTETVLVDKQQNPQSYRIWSGAPDATVVRDSQDPTSYNLANEFYVTQTAWVTHIHFYAPVTTGTVISGHIWRMDTSSSGALLATQNFGTVSSTGWQTVALSTPLQLTANQRYRVGYWTTGAVYGATSYYWSSGSGSSSKTNGIIVMPNSASALGNAQGSYVVSGTRGALPTSTFSSTNYWADVTVIDTDPTITSVSKSSTDGAAITATDSSTTSTFTSYDAAVMADAPVLYVVGSSDVSGRNHSVTTVGTPPISAMPNGDACYEFNGASQYIEVGDADDLSVNNTGILTIEAWVRPDTLEQPGAESTGDGPAVYPIIKGVNYQETGDQEYALRYYSLSASRPNRFSGYVFNPAGGLGAGSYFQGGIASTDGGTPPLLAAGDWVHVVVKIDTVNLQPDGWGTVRIYRNGVLMDHDSLGDTYNIVPENKGAPLHIGARPGHSYFQGSVAKVALYGDLSDARILDHFNAMVAQTSPSPNGISYTRTIGTAQNAVSGTTLTIPVSNTVAAGHTVIVNLAHAYTSGGPAVTDSRGNIYTRDRTAANSGATLRSSVFSAPVTTALQSGDSINITLSSAVAAKAATAIEFAGLLDTGRVDVFNSGQAAASTTGNAGNLTTTNADDLVVAMIGSLNPVTDTFTESAGYTQNARQGTNTGGAANTNVTVNSAHRIESATGTFVYGPTFGTATDSVGVHVAYKAAPAPATTLITASDSMSISAVETVSRSISKSAGDTASVAVSDTSVNVPSTPPGGAISYARTVGTAQNAVSGTTLNIPVTNTIPVGNTVILSLAHDYTSGGPTATDSRGNIYTSDRTATSTGTSSTPVIAATSSNAGSTAFAVTAPTGTTNGDLLIAVSASDWGNFSENGLPAGFTPLTTAQYDGGFNAVHLAVGYRVASSEPASYAFPVGGSSDTVGSIIRVVGAEPATTIVQAAPTAFVSGTGAVTSPSITPAGTNDLLLGFAVSDSSNVGGVFSWSTFGGAAVDVTRQSSTWTALGVGHVSSPSSPSGAIGWTSSPSGHANGVTSTISIKGTTSRMRSSVFSAPVTTQLVSGDSINITLPAAVTAKAATAVEFSGVMNVGRVDVFNSGQAAASTVGTAGNLVTTNANDLIVAMIGSLNPVTNSFTESPGYTQNARQGTNTGGAAKTNITVNSAHRIETATGSFDYNPTFGTATDSVGVHVAYKAAPVSTTTEINSSDSAAVSVTETNGTFKAVAASDQAAVSVSENTSRSTSSSASDTASIGVTESVAIFATRSSVDTASISLAESSQVLKTVVASDTVALSVSEGVSTAVTLTTSEFNALVINDSSSTAVDRTVTANETTAVTCSEATSVYKTIVSSDAAGITVADTGVLGGTLPGSETVNIAVAESATTFVTITRSDGAAISATETAGTFRGLSASDTSSISTVESSSSTGVNALTRTDTSAVSVAESRAVVTGVPVGDATVINALDTSSIFKTIVSSDNTTITVTESGFAGSSLPGTDGSALGVVDTASVAVSRAATDAISLTVGDTRSNFTTAVRTDATAVNVSEVTSLVKFVSATDTTSVSVTESATTGANRLLPGTDSAAVSVAESRAILVTQTRPDTGAVGLDEAVSVGMAKAASDTGAVSVAEVSSAFNQNANTAVKVFYQGSWTLATMKVYVNGQWTVARIKRYVGGVWV